MRYIVVFFYAAVSFVLYSVTSVSMSCRWMLDVKHKIASTCFATCFPHDSCTLIKAEGRNVKQSHFSINGVIIVSM